ncbi:MAG: aminotransferase class V-fold PLP-dependent enzyme [Alphaproteobacteria bacterium]|nr:aminotransferase class V-fold PLP-dependent enzyme [Alphaproteobacteria bacterium]
MSILAGPSTSTYQSSDKVTFCPGPGAVLDEWFSHQVPMFGRGDAYFLTLKTELEEWLRSFVGSSKNVVTLAGSGTTAACIALRNFCIGKVAVLDTGYYGGRWYAEAKLFTDTMVEKVAMDDLDRLRDFDTVIFVYVETASATKYDLEAVSRACRQHDIRLLVDATASIGLEKHHHLADVVFFSSCKGLMGPTGAGFICYEKTITPTAQNDFLYNLSSHEDVKYTIPYNVMNALVGVSRQHDIYVGRMKAAASLIRKHAVGTRALAEGSAVIGVGLRGVKLDNELDTTGTSIYYLPRKDPGYSLLFFLGLVRYDSNCIEKCLIERVFCNEHER